MAESKPADAKADAKPAPANSLREAAAKLLADVVRKVADLREKYDALPDDVPMADRRDVRLMLDGLDPHAVAAVPESLRDA